MASAVRDWLQRMAACGVPVTNLAAAGEWAPTVTCVVYPGDAPWVVARMREAGFLIGAGYGELAQHTFRIGHMGDHTVRGVQRMLDVLGRVVRGGI